MLEPIVVGIGMFTGYDLDFEKPMATSLGFPPCQSGCGFGQPGGVGRAGGPKAQSA